MHSDLEKLVARDKIDMETAEKLDLLPPGTFCHHKSWGAGKINDWDRLNTKVVIDFEDKPAHEMGMKFVASSVTPVDEDHFYAKRHSKVEELQEMAKEDPIGLARLAIASVGGKVSIDNFEVMLKGRVIAEGKYKTWWESTKKKLRGDRLFVVPTKRTDPLELRDENLDPSEALIQDFESARDLKSKAKAVDVMLNDLTAFDDPAKQMLPVVDGLNDAASKGLRLHFPAAVELVLTRDDVGTKVKGIELPEGGPTIAGIIKSHNDKIPELLQELSLTRLRGVLRAYPEAFGDEWISEILKLIPESNLRTISEVASIVADNEGADRVIDFFDTGLQQRSLSSDSLAWICRERKNLAEVIFDPSLSLAVMSSLETDQLQEETAARAANRLRDLIADDPDLIPDLIADADINTIRNFASRLITSASFDELTRKSLMARVIKMHPEVQDLVRGSDKYEDDVIFVSEESMVTRKADFDKLVKEEIPQNREDIKIARSYGDLRENFEYKSAKEYQRVLMKRKADWERELKVANPYDFSDPDTTQVSIGTRVTLESTDGGDKLEYSIMGAWDYDADKNVIAYLSERGKLLLEKKVGEDVALPTGSEDEVDRYKVASIAVA
ncbi:GreA/GreB family elongation factor [Verrucomicrobiales bacterium]|nr:GreA/GreB family elongation factor [Verrucomicrobiales bacterium]